MKAERLLARYETIADAPDAIARLRRFILDLAVRGKLVPQDEEESVHTKSKEPTDPSAPFDLPSNWRWMEIGDQLDLLNGMAFKPTDWITSGLRIVRIQNLNNPAAPFNFCHPEMARERSLIDDGSFLISWSGTPGTSFGAFIWDRGPAVLNQHIFRCDFKTNSFVARFLRLAINGQLDEMIAKAHGGVGLQHITKGKLEAVLIPLPPLAEQHRIVAKVDELMSLCDRLEAARAGREAVRDCLATASVARLNAPDPETFQADARFVLDALPALTARPDQIKALRQTILNLAVRGKLVPQDLDDEPASELLKRIFALAWTKKRKAADLEPDNDALAAAFQLPRLWAWASVDALVRPNEIVTYGILKPEWVADGVPTVRVTEMKTGIIEIASLPKCAHTRAAKFQKTTLAAGDLLISKDGTIGKTAFVPPSLVGGNITQHVLRFPICDLVDARYVRLTIDAPFGQSWMAGETKGVALQGVNVGDFRRMPIPLPPLAEQHRIVAKVDALMVLCDRLEESLAATAATRSRLLDALLAEALAPSGDDAPAVVTERASETVLVRPRITREAEKERSAVILTLAFERHRSARRDWSFGHVKAQKILHLVEAEADYDLGRSPIKDAAGPNDFPHLLAVEKWAQEHGRFAVERIGKGYTYKPLPEFKKSLAAANDIDAAARARIDKIIDLFVPMDMGEAEVFATVYAAWNNLLIEGKTPTDDDIIRGAREDWHPQKLKIPRAKFAAALRHLKTSDFVPSGRGKFVHSSKQQDLFLKR